MDRLARLKEYDKRVLRTMIGMYCRSHHHTQTLCKECEELLNYGCTKVDRCVLGTDKISCAKCSIHCYDTVHKQQIRTVMRYSGPRLIFTHPVMALRHILKEMI